MIEFQFFEGCPNAKTTYDNLVEVLQELNINEDEIRIVQVPDAESAERTNFQGSPTILIDNIDIYTELTPVGYSYSCRVYTFNNNQTGIISKEFIKAGIEKHRRA